LKTNNQDPVPCLPILSFLAQEQSRVEAARDQLQQRWPSLQLTDRHFPFDETDYYRDEMGDSLHRWWGYRETLANPADLVEWKKTCEDIEEQFQDDASNRTVNIDPGYLNYGLVVLGSHKPHHQKIYLGDGVYADPVLEYVEGSYRSFHWSFPDFQDDRYYSILEGFRSIYKGLRKD
jgi:hypothetical protein